MRSRPAWRVPSLEAVVSLDPQVVDPGLAHDLQEQIPARPETGVEDIGQHARPEQ